MSTYLQLWPQDLFTQPTSLNKAVWAFHSLTLFWWFFETLTESPSLPAGINSCGQVTCKLLLIFSIFFVLFCLCLSVVSDFKDLLQNRLLIDAHCLTEAGVADMEKNHNYPNQSDCYCISAFMFLHKNGVIRTTLSNCPCQIFNLLYCHNCLILHCIVWYCV